MKPDDQSREKFESVTIMIVDDEPTTIDVVEMLLESEGYSNFVTTSDSTQALDLVRERKPDVLLLNLMMPGVGGLEILAAIRSDRALEHLPVIILTSSNDARTKLEALRLAPDNALYRRNLRRLLTVPLEELSAGG